MKRLLATKRVPVNILVLYEKKILLMKLEEGVKYLKDSTGLQQLCIDENLTANPDELIIYMRKELDLESELSFFSVEETEDYMIFNREGVEYIQLFSVHYMLDLIESDLDILNKGFTDLHIASRLLEYRLNDA